MRIFLRARRSAAAPAAPLSLATGATRASFRSSIAIAAAWLGALAAFGLVPAIAFAQAPTWNRALIAPIEGADHAALDHGVIRSQSIAVDLSLLADIRAQLIADPSAPQQIVVPAFGGSTLTLVLTRVETVGEAAALHGSVEGVPLSSVVLVERAGIVAGNINAREFNYQIRYRGPQYGHELRDFNQSQFRDHDYEPTGPKLPEVFDGAPSPALKAATVTQADDGSTIDVMVAYTPAARDAAGGVPAMQALIALGVTETNAAYANAGVIQRIRLVHAVEVSYTESGDFATDLNRVAGKTDGYIDNIHTLRDQYGADAVSLWIESAGSTCGVARVMTTVSVGFESNAFNVVNRSCATGYYSFAHELGHNMGLRHDTYMDPGTTPYAYAHGYVDPTQGLRTVMGYNDACAAVSRNCTRIQWFSNPGINYNTFTTGNANTANAKLALDNTRTTVANFRASVGTPASTAPAITSANAATFYVGSAGSFGVTRTGNPAPTLSMTGALPATITFNPTTGTFAGTPVLVNVGVYMVTFSAVNGTLPNATQTFTLTIAPLPSCTLDVDGNGQLDALTDGMLILRTMFGLSGTQVTAGAIGTGATRTAFAQISPLISLPVLDIDGNGRTDALTDGVLLMRAMFGLTGTQVTNNALGTSPAATRNTWTAIRNYLNTTCGTNFAP